MCRFKTPPCAFRTPPCVPGKRPHVQHMRAFSGYTRRRLERTRRRFESTHGGIFRVPSRTTPHHQRTDHNTTTQRTHRNTRHMRTTISTHTPHIHIHRHHPHTTHTTPHYTKPSALVRQPTEILRRKSECLDMCTDAPPTMFLHSIKICNICNVCNFMRTLLFLELISSAKINSVFFLLAEMVLELINNLHLKSFSVGWYSSPLSKAFSGSRNSANSRLQAILNDVKIGQCQKSK